MRGVKCLKILSPYSLFQKGALFLLSYFHSPMTVRSMHIPVRWIGMGMSVEIHKYAPPPPHTHTHVCKSAQTNLGKEWWDGAPWIASRDKHKAESSTVSWLLFVHLKYDTSAVFLVKATFFCRLDSPSSHKDTKHAHVKKNQVIKIGHRYFQNIHRGIAWLWSQL